MGLRFTPTSFFPVLELNDILEIEFQISNAIGIAFDYNRWEYYEFVWRFERLVEERKKEVSDSKSEDGRMAMSNLGINMGAMGETP